MKRLLDVVLAGAGLILLLPLLCVVAILVRRDMGNPVLFRQKRPGLHGKPFTMLKFRTMRDAVDQSGEILPDDMRLTALGRKLRATSIDELPQLWNVLRGDMSLVGPRPLLLEYLKLYTNEQATRHNVLPGITGWAQICGRNAVTWDDRLRYDVWYVTNQSLWLDIKILALTIPKVLRREGGSPNGESAHPKFTPAE